MFTRNIVVAQYCCESGLASESLARNKGPFFVSQLSCYFLGQQSLISFGTDSIMLKMHLICLGT